MQGGPLAEFGFPMAPQSALPSTVPISGEQPYGPGPASTPPAAPMDISAGPSDWPADSGPDYSSAIASDINADFEARHGRQPTDFEVSAIHALPMIKLNLGRMPTRMEMLQFLQSRDMTPPSAAPQFEPDTSGAASGSAATAPYQ